ncbi:conserved hypothetical protein [Azospirillaceae bacterium]|nr:hypothetical protein MTCCP1_00032 [uncultured bacterium]
MPLDDLQVKVLKVLSANRTPKSVFAGGSVLQRHGHRLSDDQDIFHNGDIDLQSTAANDVRLLELNGFECSRTKMFEGFIEFQVGTEDDGFTRVQWVQAGEWNFFEPVPDPEYGWRLHYADLAVNKVLAAASRKEIRDFIDLALIHAAVMPLWHALWAAPGKDESWSPGSLVERILAHSGFRQADAEGIVSTEEVSVSAVIRQIRTALEEAKETFLTLPTKTAGKLFVEDDGTVVLSAKDIKSMVKTLDARRGGTFPSGPDIDHVIIKRIAREGRLPA